MIYRAFLNLSCHYLFCAELWFNNFLKHVLTQTVPCKYDIFSEICCSVCEFSNCNSSLAQTNGQHLQGCEAFCPESVNIRWEWSDTGIIFFYFANSTIWFCSAAINIDRGSHCVLLALGSSPRLLSLYMYYPLCPWAEHFSGCPTGGIWHNVNGWIMHMESWMDVQANESLISGKAFWVSRDKITGNLFLCETG